MTDEGLLPDGQQDEGYRIGTLLLTPAAWVHRRVEHLSFRPDGTAERHVSVDFDAPLHLLSPPKFVPLAFLDKELLVDFDLRGEGGESIPLATREQNATVALAVLGALAETILGKALSNGDLNRLGELAWRTSPRDSAELRETLRGSGSDFPQLFQDDVFAEFTRVFSTRFLLLTPYTGWEERRVVKFSYVEGLGSWGTQSAGLWLARIPGSLSWRPLEFEFEVGGFGRGFPHHLELVAPAGLEIQRTEVTGPASSTRSPRSRTLTTRAHILFNQGVDLDSRTFVGLSLRPQRTGFLRGAFLSTLLVAAVMTLIALFPPEMGNSEPTSVLLALPGILALIVAGKGEHPLLSAMLLGLRSVVVGAAALVFGAAFQLSGGIDPLCLSQWPPTGLDGCGLRPTWTWGAVLGWLLFLITVPAMIAASDRPTEETDA